MLVFPILLTFRRQIRFIFNIFPESGAHGLCAQDMHLSDVFFGLNSIKSGCD